MKVRCLPVDAVRSSFQEAYWIHALVAAYGFGCRKGALITGVVYVKIRTHRDEFWDKMFLTYQGHDRHPRWHTDSAMLACSISCGLFY